ncbi:MAG: four helix bundle protein [Bacteroidota bacterium]|nr:four helix bundle protein [Bacteroidota bacterium]
MKKEFEARLVKYSVDILEIAENMRKDFMGKHLSSQIIRSGSSVALNYGECQSAQSRKDFIHKASVILKELRETIINLRIISEKKLCRKEELLLQVIKESDELIAIFYKTIQTCRRNDNS